MKKYKRILWGVFLVLMLLSLFWLTRFITERQNSELHHHLPTDADFIVKVDNSNLIHQFLFDFLYHAKIEKKDIQQLEYQASKKDIKNTGINFQREIYIFHEDWNRKNVFGFLFHLKDHKTFAKYVDNLPDKIFKAFNDKIACVLFMPEKLTIDEHSPFEFYANDLLQKNPNRTRSRITFANSSPSSLFHIYFSGDYDDYIQHMSVETYLKKNQIKFTGYGKKNPLIDPVNVEQHFITQELSDSCFHIQAKKVPDTLQHYLNKVLKNIDIELPNISSQQLLIYGFEVQQIDKNILALPLFDGVFRFKDTISMDIEDEMSRLSKEKKWIQKQKSFKVGSTPYYVKKLSPNELYIGINEQPSIEKLNKNHFFLAAGNPLSLINITGKGVITQIAKLLPPVQNTKQFLQNVDHFEIVGRYDSVSDTTLFDGKITFTEDRTASIEIMKFLLRF